MKTHCRFIDGPAIGVTLTLLRAPLMLRVVCDAERKWDALDQVDDEARADEAIHVYRASSQISRGHVLKVVKGRRCGSWFQMLEYRVWKHPGDEHVRKTADWSRWCEANKDELVGKSGATEDHGD